MCNYESYGCGCKRNGVSACVVQDVLLHIQGLHCGEGIFYLEDHVGQEALSSNLLPNIRFVRKFLLQVFLIIC